VPFKLEYLERIVTRRSLLRTVAGFAGALSVARIWAAGSQDVPLAIEHGLRTRLAKGPGYIIFEWKRPEYGYTQFGLNEEMGLFLDVPLCCLSDRQVALTKSLLEPFGIPPKEVKKVGPVYQIPVRGPEDGARLAWAFVSRVHGVARVERLATVLEDWD